ncbi:MAG: 3-oxoacyl-ACP reductase [Alphaproteobacteria bacterium]|nr:MAG: 3-oxoacyl-ACP reductase [Alphaproteobacteria bacterium]
MTIKFTDKVAIVTGAGAGLGRSHALGLAARGAKVVVNDLGRDGQAPESALAVVKEITNLGGEAIAHGANVADMDQVQDMVDQAMSKWGRVDILVNNAGILRDKTFSKMTIEDFKLVVDVHLMGAVNCTKAVWEIMKTQEYGRIVMTSSSSGLYGNFGQSNYGAAKMGLVGLMNVLAQEGRKYNIHVNALAPTAATQMTEGLITPQMTELMTPESVTPALLFLVSEGAPTRTIVGAGAGAYAVTRIFETDGLWLAKEDQTPEGIAANWDNLMSTDNQKELMIAGDQTLKFVQKAAEALGIDLNSEFGVK